MPHYMVLLLNRMVKWLPKPDYSGTMSGRKITCRRLDYWSRASLVPAAAVIPALKVYIVIAAVKKLVVGSASQDLVHPLDENWAPRLILPVFPTLP
uniref:Uncharacterized protein n=1 Tax=Onchocerca volvulus TaxID=6282 RepID=A0A8R1TQL1_ONCVO